MHSGRECERAPRTSRADRGVGIRCDSSCIRCEDAATRSARTCRCAVGNARQTCSRCSPDLSSRVHPTRALSSRRHRAPSSPTSSSRSRTRRREKSASFSRPGGLNTYSVMFRRIHRAPFLCQGAQAIRPASSSSRRARARRRTFAPRDSCCRRERESYGHSTKPDVDSS